MIPRRTPKARLGRVGVWASPLIAAALLLVFFFVLPLAPPAHGATQSDVLKQQLAKKVAALDQASSKLLALGKDLDALETARDASAEKLASVMVDMNGVQDDIEQAEKDLATLRIQLEDRLVNIYKSGGSWSGRYLEALVVEGDLASVLGRIDVLSTIAGQDQQLFTEVDGFLKQAQADKIALEKKRAEQQAQGDALVQSIEQLSAKKAQFETQHQSLQAQMASLSTQIRQAEAMEAAAAAAAAARLKAVADAAKRASDKVGPATPTTTRPTTPTTAPSTPSGAVKPPTSAAQIKAQADFIYRTFLAPRKSVLSGQMIIDLWTKYGISPAQSLAVLNAESGMGSLKWGGRLVKEANNFGCMGYSASPPWVNWSPPISHGKIYVADRFWMKFYSVADGIEAWGRYISYGRGHNSYIPLLKTANWTAFADIYYGKNVPGKAKYITRLTDAYGSLKRASRAAGYSW